MASEITKLRISILLDLATSDNIILSLKRKNPRIAHILKITLHCMFLAYIFYNLFFSKNLNLFSFLSVIISGLGIAQFLGFFPNLSDIFFYFDHRNDFLRNLSVLEFLNIMRPTRAFLGTLEKNGFEENFINSLNSHQQLVLLKLGATLNDLSHLKTEKQCADEIGLGQNSLQWMAMKAFIQAEKTFSFELPTPLENIYVATKTYLNTNRDVVDKALVFNATQSREEEQIFVETQTVLHRTSRHRMSVN